MQVMTKWKAHKILLLSSGHKTETTTTKDMSSTNTAIIFLLRV